MVPDNRIVMVRGGRSFPTSSARVAGSSLAAASSNCHGVYAGFSDGMVTDDLADHYDTRANVSVLPTRDVAVSKAPLRILV